MKTFLAFTVLIVVVYLFTRLSFKEQKNDIMSNVESSEAAEALEAWIHARVYPGNTLPADRYLSEFEKLQNRKLQRAATFPGQWDAIGPKNFGGRTLCLAFNPANPQTIYAGSASGGLWRSYSGGTGANAWHPVPTGFPVIGVGAIAIDPLDSNVIYIGTGEVYFYQNTGTGFAIRTTRGTYGIGILKSTDGGTNWTQALPWQLSDLRGVQDIIVNPQNSNTVFAATTEGVFRSHDAGSTWIQSSTVLMATDINYKPGDTTLMLLASGNSASTGAGIYRSVDGGASFSRVVGGLPATWSGKTLISFSPSNPGIAYASIANQVAGLGLYKSIDGGLIWTAVNSLNYQSYQGWYSHDVAVRPDNPDEIFCGGVDTYHSVDGGITLNQSSYWFNWDFNATTIGGIEGLPDYVHADIHHIYWHPSDYNIIYFVTDGGIFRSTNGGVTFEGCNGMYQTQQFYANFSNSPRDSLFAIGGMQDNATAVYEGNLGWRRVIGGDGVSTAIHPANDSIVYGEYQYLSMLRSDDHANNFFSLGVSTGTVQNFAGPFVVCPSAPDILYAGSDYVAKSIDGGFSWNYMNSGVPLDGNPVLVLEVSQTDENIVYAATTPVILPQINLYKTIDGGNTWTDVTAGLPDRYIMDVAIDPEDNEIVYTAISGFGTNHVYKSTDGGSTWNASDINLPDVPTNTICIDPLNHTTIYAGNDLGVFVSIDGGASWSDYNDGLYDATFVMDISVSPSNRKLRIATHGKGVFEREMLPLTVNINPVIAGKFTLMSFPNPVLDRAEIYSDAGFTENVTVTIYNTAGRVKKIVMRCKPVNKNKIIVDMNDMSDGIYFLKISDTRASGVIKIIKN